MTDRYSVTEHRYVRIIDRSVVFVEGTGKVEILNETATMIFESLTGRPGSILDVVDYLSEQFGDGAPSRETIRHDTTRLFDHWKTIGLIERFDCSQ